MAVISREILSASTNGESIKIVATATPGTLIHTATVADHDEIFLWATNSDSAVRQLTIEFGGTTAPDHLVKLSLPPVDGYVLVIPGLTLTGGALVRGFASVANVIVVAGYVNRIA